MIRNLKALGLALVAIFAMSALAASAASAQGQGLLTADGPVTLKATETGAETANALTSFGNRVSCPGSSLTGHGVLTHEQTEKGTKHGLIAVPAMEVTITPHYNQKACNVNGGAQQATVETNGCDYVLKAGVTTGGADTYGASVSVTCPPEKKIHVGVWANGSSHLEGRLCTIEVGSQTVSGAHLKHTTAPADDIDVEGTFTGIKVERHGLCLLDGKGTSTATGEFHIDMTVKGYNASGEETPVTITDLA